MIEHFINNRYLETGSRSMMMILVCGTV